MPLGPDDALVERFERALAALMPEEGDARLGVAVSGGPDSVALLLLAAAARPGAVEAATVDHGFRSASSDEAADVADLCARLGIPHSVLKLDWSPPKTNRQAQAREGRYDALAQWAATRKLAAVATAHHLDDQAETMLMRLHRGAGVGGLSAIRPALDYAATDGATLRLIRPLLDWRKAELAAIPSGLGIAVVTDPANSDPAHDRTLARRVLEQSPDWPDRRRLAASAGYLAQADAALAWSARRLLEERLFADGDGWRFDVTDIPTELRRRLLLLTMAKVSGDAAVRGDRVERALRLLEAGRVATLGGVVVRPQGACWRMALAPPRRSN